LTTIPLTDAIPTSWDAALDQARAFETVDRSTSGGPPVAMLAWPAQQDLLPQLRRDRVPRLLLLAPDAVPMVDPDVLQDWIRLPAPGPDLRARLARLRAVGLKDGLRPLVGGDGRLLYGPRWIVLSPGQERLARVLAEHFGHPVKTESLLGPGLGRPSTLDGLRALIHGLRRALGPLGLQIVSLHGLGYTLQSRSVPTSTPEGGSVPPWSDGGL
jgi:hypothetical protein